MWCRKCNKFYDTESDTCEKCGQKLEDYTPIVESDEDDVLFLSNEPKQNDDEPETAAQQSKTPFAEMLFDGEPKLLITVIGEDEAARTMELLEQNNIPSMKKEAQVHTADEECDNDFEGEELEFIDEQEESEDYEAEFSALCDEALEGEELYDIFVPAECFSDALRIVIEDEQADGGASDDMQDAFGQYDDTDNFGELEDGQSELTYDEGYDEQYDEQSDQQSDIYVSSDTDADAEDFENGRPVTSGQQSEPSDGQNGEKDRGGKKKNGLFGFLHRKEK